MVAAAPRDVRLAELLATASPLNPGPTGITDLLGAILATRPPWMADALCAEPHPGVDFFPEQGGDVRPAKQICSRCLVKAECRAWALEQGDDLRGVWAGTTHRQRRQIRQAGAPARPPVVMAADGRPRPDQLMERLSAFLAARPDETFTASAIRNETSGNTPAMVRALGILVDEGFVAVTIGGISKGRPYPAAPFYRHLRTYIAGGSVTVVVSHTAACNFLPGEGRRFLDDPRLDPERLPDVGQIGPRARRAEPGCSPAGSGDR